MTNADQKKILFLGRPACIIIHNHYLATCFQYNQTSFAPKIGWGMLVYAQGWSLANSQFWSYTAPHPKKKLVFPRPKKWKLPAVPTENCCFWLDVCHGCGHECGRMGCACGVGRRWVVCHICRMLRFYRIRLPGSPWWRSRGSERRAAWFFWKRFGMFRYIEYTLVQAVR